MESWTLIFEKMVKLFVHWNNTDVNILVDFYGCIYKDDRKLKT